MIEEEAVVASVDAGQVWVEKARQSACGTCAQRCATADVAGYFGKDTLRLAVASPIEVGVGDRVVLGIREDAIVKGSLGVYLVPLLGLLAGAILGKLAGVSLFFVTADVAAALGGAAGLIAAIAFLKYTGVLSRAAPRPVVLRKIN